MSEAMTAAGLAFVTMFLLIMVLGINNSLVNSGAIDHITKVQTGSSMTCSGVYTDLLTQPQFAVPFPSTCNIANRNEFGIGAGQTGTGFVDTVNLIPPQNVFEWVACVFAIVGNAFVSVLNVAVGGLAYFINIIALMFTPCSIFQGSPLFAVIFIPMLVATILIAMNIIKPMA